MASLLDQYKKEQMWNNLSRIGQGLLMASAGNMPLGQGLAMGLGQMQPPDMGRMQALREEDREQRQQTARSKVFGGYDPATEITWNQGQPGLMGTPKGLSLLAQSNPRAMEAAYLKSAMTPQKPYTDIAKLNADLDAGRISRGQYEKASARLGRPEKAPSITGRMRWIMATGRDPETGRQYDDEQRALFQKAMAPGSAETREAFLRDWTLANARNFRIGPEVMEEGNQLYDMISGVEPRPEPAQQEFGAVEAALPPGPPVPGRKPQEISPRGSSVTIPLPPMELDPDIRTRADEGTFTEEDLIELQANDPEQFELLYKHLKGGSGVELHGETTPEITPQQQYQSHIDHVVARYQMAIQTPMAERTEQQKRDIKRFRDTLGFPERRLVYGAESSRGGYRP